MIPGTLLILFSAIDKQVEGMLATTNDAVAQCTRPCADVLPVPQLCVGRAQSIDEETETCKGQATCPSQHRQQRAEPGCERPANGL